MKIAIGNDHAAVELKNGLFPNICSFAKNYYLLYTIAIRRESDYNIT